MNKQKVSTDKTALFETVPVKKAAVTLIVPTVISQLILVLYNMADTWYIGQTADPYQVAAVTVTYPLFMLLSALSNLFGVGGGSHISRLLGRGARETAGPAASFALWMGGGCTFVYSLLCLFFSRQLLVLLGTDEAVIGYAAEYLFWTVTVGGVPTVLGMIFANIIRAEGEAKLAGFGMSLGGVLNMVFDPLFIFTFHMGVAGAALSTCVSNTFSLLFLITVFSRKRANHLVQIPLRPVLPPKADRLQICAVGAPAALQIILASISNAVLLRLMSAYAVEATSGLGVMQKVESLPFQAIMGISSGILPLIAYSYAAGNRKRMQEAVRFALSRGVLCACICFVLYEVFSPAIIRFFLDDAASVAYGAAFLRLRVLALPFTTAEFMLIAVFQGVGGAKQAFALSVFRKGTLDLPLMLLADRLFPMYGLVLVQPVMELCGCILALALYRRLQRQHAGNFNRIEA